MKTSVCHYNERKIESENRKADVNLLILILLKGSEQNIRKKTYKQVASWGESFYFFFKGQGPMSVIIQICKNYYDSHLLKR